VRIREEKWKIGVYVKSNLERYGKSLEKWMNKKRNEKK